MEKVTRQMTQWEDTFVIHVTDKKKSYICNTQRAVVNY